VLTYWQAVRFRGSPLKGFIWRVQFSEGIPAPTGGRNGWAVPLVGGFLIATASFVLSVCRLRLSDPVVSTSR